MEESYVSGKRGNQICNPGWKDIKSVGDFVNSWWGNRVSTQIHFGKKCPKKTPLTENTRGIAFKHEFRRSY